jgi:hypothetical protein
MYIYRDAFSFAVYASTICITVAKVCTGELKVPSSAVLGPTGGAMAPVYTVKKLLWHFYCEHYFL